MSGALAGRVAVVTGATRGIGWAIAERFVAEGATVVATGRRGDAPRPAGCSYVSVDLDDDSSTADFLAELGRLQPDILVNNAGVNKVSPFTEIARADFDRIQRVNIQAPFLFCQAVVPGMRRKKWGRIVNISSIWGKLGKEFRASYAASKFALAGMTSSLAAEVAKDGILANCVSPGPIETEMTRKNLTPPMLAELLQLVPAGRLGRAEEVAALVAWLAGPENTFVAGQNIAIDGGMTRV